MLALFNLCVLIQSTPGMVDVALIRGAVFFIGRSYSNYRSYNGSDKIMAAIVVNLAHIK